MRLADAITLTGAIVASFSIALATRGDYEYAIRLLFISYALDVLDGVVARRYGSTKEGFMFDRAVDRYSQIIVPSILLLLTTADSKYYIEYSIYVSILVPVALYRLAHRRVESLAYFSGSPLLVHPLVILGYAIMGSEPNIILLYTLLVLTIIPLKYYRRPVEKRTGELFTMGRIIIVLIIVVIPYYSPISMFLGYLMIIGSLLYAILGAIIYYIKIKKDLD